MVALAAQESEGRVTAVVALPSNARAALARFDSLRELRPSLAKHRANLASAVDAFARGVVAARRQRDPFITRNADSFDLITRSVRSTIGTLDRAIAAIDDAEARLEAAGRNAGLGFPPLYFAVLVVAALAAGGASIGAYNAIDEHFAEQAALRNQLRDLRERCAKGQATPAVCDEFIPKLEAAISGNPLERVSSTATRVLWIIAGAFVLSFVIKMFRKG